MHGHFATVNRTKPKYTST